MAKLKKDGTEDLRKNNSGANGKAGRKKIGEMKLKRAVLFWFTGEEMVKFANAPLIHDAEIYLKSKVYAFVRKKD